MAFYLDVHLCFDKYITSDLSGYTMGHRQTNSEAGAVRSVSALLKDWSINVVINFSLYKIYKKYLTPYEALLFEMVWLGDAIFTLAIWQEDPRSGLNRVFTNCQFNTNQRKYYSVPNERGLILKKSCLQR